jgi:translation initiation factor 1
MSKNKKIKRDNDGIVYSTDSDFVFKDLFEQLPLQESDASQGKRQVNIRIEHKGRGGKTVTLVEGLVIPQQDIDALAKSLKNHCGCGGSVEGQTILIQGDQRRKIMLYLQDKGFKTNNPL